MPRPPAPPLSMTSTQRHVLDKIARSSTAAHREVTRARVLLDAADGLANAEIARRHDASVVTVRAWRKAFESEGLQGWGKVKPGRGRPATIGEDKIAEIVELTATSAPKGHTHWSTRTMAEHVGVSHSKVQQIWSDLGLKPHRLDTFKVSNDPKFTEKLIDVVGLYLNPPQRAVVLCMDEKSQIQALDRSQPSLPMTKGRAATMTHDYRRNGTTTLFAALDVLTGKVIGQCLPAHTAEEFIKFLNTIDHQVPPGLQVHLILDNYSTHKHAKVQRWLTRHQRFHLHFTPTSSSWLNQVERWFRELTEKNIRRGIFPSVPDLIASIETFLEAHNDNPKPYVWTATAESILTKVQRARTTLHKQQANNQPHH